MKSFAYEVQAPGPDWAGNAVRLRTYAEAEREGSALAMRWSLVTDTRVVESPDLPNYESTPAGLRRITFAAEWHRTEARFMELSAEFHSLAALRRAYLDAMAPQPTEDQVRQLTGGAPIRLVRSVPYVALNGTVSWRAHFHRITKAGKPSARIYDVWVPDLGHTFTDAQVEVLQHAVAHASPIAAANLLGFEGLRELFARAGVSTLIAGA